MRITIRNRIRMRIRIRNRIRMSIRIRIRIRKKKKLPCNDPARAGQNEVNS